MMGVIDESLVDDAVAAGRRIVAGEIPVSRMVRNASPQVFAGEEDDFQLGVEIVRKKPFRNGFRQFVVGELRIEPCGDVLHVAIRPGEFLLRQMDVFLKERVHRKATSSLKDAMSMP